ncbi:hypothetical protein [Embleya sp. NPDC005971]|uniref:hypothetical protein n=1 Tax=Embleya sp. NPDC005971 TaxID=3156724 RepID=UPI0034058709
MSGEFEIWWIDRRAHIRLKPVDPNQPREDFDRWIVVRDSAAAGPTARSMPP